MGNNYEQEFINNLENETNASAVVPKTARFSRLSIIIIVILLLVIIAEAAIIIVTPSRGGQNTEAENSEDVINDSELGQDFSTDNSYIYDESDNLTALNIDCAADDGERYTFNATNAYEEYSPAATKVGSGTYKIIHDGIVVLKDANDLEQVVYFDGFDIAKGTKFFTCKALDSAN